MIRTKILFSVSIFLVLSTCRLYAGGYITPERAAADNLARAFKYHLEFHNGQLPTTWGELGQYIDLERINRSLVNTHSYPLQQHYLFAQGQFPTVDSGRSELLMIRKGPLKNDKKEQGRYIIYRDSQGHILADWIPEEEVQDLLKQPGIKLFPPQPLEKPSGGGVPTPPSLPATNDQVKQSKADIGQKTDTAMPPPETSSSTSANKSESTGVDSKPIISEQPSSFGKWLFIVVLLIGALAAGWILLRRPKNP